MVLDSKINMKKFIAIIFAFMMIIKPSQMDAMSHFSKFSLRAKLSLGIIPCLLGYFYIKPYIQKRIEVPQITQPQHYSIQFQWIYKKNDMNQPYVYPSDTKFGNQFSDTILAWAKKNPECETINLWFDSAFVSKKAIENTQKFFDQENKYYNSTKIKVCDIRQLATVKKHEKVFSKKIPVYFRKDLLSIVIAHEMVEQNHELYCVCIDFDIPAMTKKELFDKDTMHNLNKYNFVMAYEKNIVGFENSFQIITYNQELSRAIHNVLIEANIAKAQSFLEDSKEKMQPENIFNNPLTWKIHKVGFQENVFYSYPLMFTYLCQLQNKGKLLLPGATAPYNENNNEKIADVHAKIMMT